MINIIDKDAMKELLKASNEQKQLIDIYRFLKKEYMLCGSKDFSRYKEFNVDPASINNVILAYVELYCKQKKEIQELKSKIESLENKTNIK